MIRRSCGLLASGKPLFLPKSWNFVPRTSWFAFSDTLSVVLEGFLTYQHKYEPENNENTPFEFTAENMATIKKIIAKYPPNYQASAVIPILDLAQRQHGGWTPVAAMKKIAKILGMKEIDVFEVASFYTMFNRTPIGRYHVQGIQLLTSVCGTTPCDIRGAQGILKACEEQLGVKCGHSTADRKFHLTEVECLGACVNAPMIQINDEYYVSRVCLFCYFFCSHF